VLGVWLQYVQYSLEYRSVPDGGSHYDSNQNNKETIMAMTRILSNCFYTLHRNIKKINTDPHRQFIRNESTSKRSGLQKQVLGLYRKLLRTSHSKRQSSQTFPESLADPASTVFAVKKKFRGKADSVSRRDVDRIEYYIRQGEKYVKTLDMYGVKGMHTV